MALSVLIKIVSKFLNIKYMNKKIKVGISNFDPLVIKLPNNKYTGFEIELWEMIANKLDLDFEYEEVKFKNLIDAVKNTKFDVGIAGITRTKKRETKVNFSYYTLRSGLSILISKKSKISLIS